MAAPKLVGQNYTVPDLVAKVTGKSKYAEDFRAEGMIFAKLLLSPLPHARVTRLDTTAAMAMPGVKAILTFDDLPKPADSINDNGQVIFANIDGEVPLTNEPVYQGQPILAVAAVDEVTAADAIEKIQIDFEPLPFVVDPLVSLRPGGPNARTKGNYWFIPPPAPAPPGGGQAQNPPRPDIKELKYADGELAEAKDGQLPILSTAPETWAYGDLEAGFKEAALVLDETYVSPDTSHQTLETRTCMAYWQNGKLHIYTGTQSTVQTVGGVARWVGIPPENVVVVSEYTGGGFGSKITGGISLIIPALLAKKANAPVMMRISREEEHYIGRARPGVRSRMKVGFTKEGRITALDMFSVSDNGPFERQGDCNNTGVIASLAYQPKAMRFRGISVLTNTPPRGPQSQPGGTQSHIVMEPVIAKAARKLGIDQVAIRRLNSPEGKALFGPPAGPKAVRQYVTSAFIKQALDKGAQMFRWDERKLESGKRKGSKVRGVGVAVSTYSAGSVGFDGLFVIKPDGMLYVQSGIGNHGTGSVSDCHRVSAELLGVPWDKVVVTSGDTSKNLPWTCPSGGSQTIHAMTRAAHAAGMDAKKKLQEIAAKDLGGRPEDYDVAGERVARKGGGPGMTLAKAAQRAVELGGAYDGHELPKDINRFTRTSATALVGQGLMGVAKDNYPHDGQSRSFVAGFAEVEIDVETGKYHILDYLAVADVGTVIHPRNLGGQILGRSMLGIGHAIGQKWVYDQHYGVALARRFHHNKPPTILDAPQHMDWAAVELPDPETPTGARGIGEPPVGAGACAVLNAISDALGDEIFRRAPVTLDMILTALEAGRPTTEPLTAHI
ncbi:MAG: xanthine dehydrogenase family protein molybdopterin-binding subunit [Acidobacteriota bacterium]